MNINTQLVDSLRELIPGSYTAAVILAAGNSTRMGAKQNKQLQDLNGIPVLAHTLIAYQKCPLIREIVVVARPQDFGDIYNLRERFGIRKLTKLAIGGETRQESARRGFEKLGEHVKYVAIADGARCLITPKQISRICLTAYRFKAASAAHRISDTVKRTSVVGNTRETIDRTDLWEAQTPQVFHTSLYAAALYKADRDRITVTDDNSIVEHLGYTVRLVECGIENLKITTPDDVPTAEAILRYRKAQKQEQEND